MILFQLFLVPFGEILMTLASYVLRKMIFCSYCVAIYGELRNTLKPFKKQKSCYKHKTATRLRKGGLGIYIYKLYLQAYFTSHIYIYIYINLFKKHYLQAYFTYRLATSQNILRKIFYIIFT